MKKLLIITALALGFSTVALAQDKGLGLGIAIGDPDGIVGKYWLSSTHAVDFGFGIAVGPTTVKASGGKENAGSRIHLRASYVMHKIEAIQSSEKFPIYLGAGGYLETGAGSDEAFGLRGVGGLIYWVQQAPLDLFLEVAPTLQLEPSVGFGFQSTIGVRYYFGS